MAVNIYTKLLYDSRPTQTNSWIVIHNSSGGFARYMYDWFKSPEANGNCAHYGVDDKDIVQLLKDNWKGQHTRGDGHYAAWGEGLPPGTCTNHNSIGIEISDDKRIDFDAALDYGIELTRYLMKQYNIAQDHIVRHGDTQDKQCPETIMKMKKWDYFLEEVKKRNAANQEFKLDFSKFGKADMDGSSSDSGLTPTPSTTQTTIELTYHDTTTTQESLPNANQSDNWVDMHKIKGITLHFYPPYHECAVDAMPKYFESLGWNRSFHYKVDKDTKIDFDKKPVSGQTTGGNTVGTSAADFVVKPKDPLYHGVVIGGETTSIGGGDTSTADEGYTEVTGGDVADSVNNFFMSKGFTLESACGIMGNLEKESSMSPTTVNSSSGASGIAQWLGGRFANLKKYAEQKGKTWKDLGVQLNFLMQEVTGGEATTTALLKKKCNGIEGFKKLTDVADATRIWEESFERAGSNCYMDDRIKFAKSYYKKYKDKVSTSNGNKDNETESKSVKVLSTNKETVFGWPCPGRTYVSANYGYLTDFSNAYRMHGGIDISGFVGDSVHAFADGKVEIVNTEINSTFDKYIKINHGNGWYTYYAHIDNIKVNVNDTVNAGQVIANIGEVQNYGIPCLHFELWKEGKRINPLDYVIKGGGATISTLSDVALANSIQATIMDMSKPIIVKDTIDKGKICFSCANNNQHTFIERALFNNQYAKYTLSIGAFIDTQADQIEKDKKYDWPTTEKVLIQQTAKALYDEGFTSKQLWREFDLNRAPSPFMYLDQEKWIAFCDAVDDQVKWLNTKYGEVTSTYVPNDLLTDQNTNEFVETAPDGGIQGSTGSDPNNPGGGSTTTPTVELDGGIWVGDSRTVMMKEYGSFKNGPKVDIYCKSGVTASYFYSDKNDRTSGWNENAKYIFIWLGINNVEAPKLTINLIDHLKKRFKCPIYLARETYVAVQYNECGYGSTKMNKCVDKMNQEYNDYCSKTGDVYLVDISSGVQSDSAGYKRTHTTDGLHYNKEGNTMLYNNICKAISGKDNSSTAKTSSLDFTAFDKDKDTNTANKDKAEEKTPAVNTNIDTAMEDILAFDVTEEVFAYTYKSSGNKLYAKPDTGSKVVGTFGSGYEFYIDPKKTVNNFYEIYRYTLTVDGKDSKRVEGYMLANDLIVQLDTKRPFGVADKGRLGAVGWLIWDTIVFPEPVTLKNQSKLKNLKEIKLGKKIKIIDIDKDQVGYKVMNLQDQTTGWVKPYRVTFTESSIDIIENDNNDSGESLGEERVIDYEIEGGNFESDGQITGWEEVGKANALPVKNPEWGQEGHWNYREDYFLRLRVPSAKEGVCGAKCKIVVPKKTKNGTMDVRILFWIKQVTVADNIGGELLSPEVLSANGISVYLLSKNGKTVAQRKISFAEYPNDKFAHVGCVFTNVADGDYSVLIGGDFMLDVFIDDVTCQFVTRYEDLIGETNSSTAITVSGVGTTNIDNGGVMTYSVAKPKDANAKQPDIPVIVTQEEFVEIMTHATPRAINVYTNSFEPYHKNLDILKNITVTEDQRIYTLTSSWNTLTGNSIYFNVVETGPGSTDHCVKPVDELNSLYKVNETLVDPVYPDLIIPYNYSTGDYDKKSENSIPLAALTYNDLDTEKIKDKQFSYEYETLNKVTKKSSGKPINYNDAYPIDDKITELEEHHPKVVIDEIESRLYSCNHPGCPIAQPMADNFAMLNDMNIEQSKKTEKRLSRLENVLAWAIRNLGRVGSRMSINCVYYGGQNIFGKYKTIRCMRDDRVHDGCTVTLDQCLCCTRYEPIEGQIYDILDETGFNGSAILDDMQMSYMSLDNMKSLNYVERRSVEYPYVEVNKDPEDKDKPKTLIAEWKQADYEAHKKTVDKDKVDAIIESDYVFNMNWTETEVEAQAPDVKPYPVEGIAAKYFEAEDAGENIKEIIKETRFGMDKDKYDSLVKGTWTDTRKDMKTTETNKYSSLDYYFEDFNKNRTGYEYDNGLKVNVGLQASGGANISNGLVGAECRNKIVEKAKEIVQLHKDKKASYSQAYRTIDDTKRVTIKSIQGLTAPDALGWWGYDCASFVSCCYKYAGLSSLYNKSCSGGTVMQEIVNNGGEMWLADEEGEKKALPGDCICVAQDGVTVDQKDMDKRRKVPIKHIIVYIGNGQIAHSSAPYRHPRAIRIDELKSSRKYYKNTIFFIRPKDLIEADENAASSGGGGGAGANVSLTPGVVDGKNYVAKLTGSRCTCYGSTQKKSISSAFVAGATCASHSMPHGTKIYIPDLKGKTVDGHTMDGVFTVNDTGNAGFDFDLFFSNRGDAAAMSAGNKIKLKEHYDVYVLSWGNGPITPSHTYSLKHYDVYRAIWIPYTQKGGTTVNLYKFTQEDKNIRNTGYWDLTAKDIHCIK